MNTNHTQPWKKKTNQQILFHVNFIENNKSVPKALNRKTSNDESHS